MERKNNNFIIIHPGIEILIGSLTGLVLTVFPNDH